MGKSPQRTIGIIGVGDGSTVGYRLIEGIVKDDALSSQDTKLLYYSHKNLEKTFLSLSNDYFIKPKAKMIRDMANEADIIILTYASQREDKYMSPEVRAERFTADFRNFYENIQEELKGTKAMILIVTNPTDLLSTYIHRSLELKDDQIVGFGQQLEAARAKTFIQERHPELEDIIGLTSLGEHSSRNVLTWSRAEVKVNGVYIPFADWYDQMEAKGTPVDLDAINAEVARFAMDQHNDEGLKSVDMHDKLLYTVRDAILAPEESEQNESTITLSHVFKAGDTTFSTGVPTQFYWTKEEGQHVLRNQVDKGWAKDDKFDLGMIQGGVNQEGYQFKRNLVNCRKQIRAIDADLERRLQKWDEKGPTPLPELKKRKRKALVYVADRVELWSRVSQKGKAPAPVPVYEIKLDPNIVQDKGWKIKSMKYRPELSRPDNILLHIIREDKNRHQLVTTSLDGTVRNYFPLSKMIQTIEGVDLDDEFAYAALKSQLLKVNDDGFDTMNAMIPISAIHVNAGRIYMGHDKGLMTAPKNDFNKKIELPGSLDFIERVMSLEWDGREVVFTVGVKNNDSMFEGFIDDALFLQGVTNHDCFDAHISKGSLHFAYQGKKDEVHDLRFSEMDEQPSEVVQASKLDTSKIILEKPARKIVLDHRHVIAALWQSKGAVVEYELGSSQPREFLKSDMTPLDISLVIQW